MYTLTWAPDIPSNFTVYANFGGTNSYWPSSSETSFAVNQMVTPSPTTTTAVSFESTQMYILGVGIAIIIVLIIIGAVLAMLIRRKP